ncbi:MAG TPA: hypothetical protein VFU41_15320 [Gemmatimonadales bacterium]|nr:hypothetical protein [Gemmatimonadales bacterium]
MTRPRMNLLAVVAGLMAVACGEQRESLPAAPEFHIVTGSSSGCDFIHIKKLANQFFTNSSQRQTVSRFVTEMKQAFGTDDYSPTVKAYGFDIMAEIAAAVHNSQVGTATSGSDLTNHLILCMFDPTLEAAAYPVTFPENFTVSLTPLAHGAYEVPRSSTGASDAVCSRPLPVSPPCTGFSGIAPSSGSWSTTTIVPGGRVLIYGRPGEGPQVYTWKVVPASAQFSPDLIVAVCVDPNAAPAALLHEQNVGLLPFVDAGFMLPGLCSSTALLNGGWSTFSVARGLARWGTGLFTPRPLWAGTVVNPGGLGGSTGAIRSDFGPQDVVVDLRFLSQPQDATVGQPIPTSPPDGLKVQETSAAGVVPSTTITLQAADNNGSTVSLTSTLAACSGDTCSAPADANGVANFGSVTISKTGGYRFRATATVAGRPGVPVNEATSNQFNVRP